MSASDRDPLLPLATALARGPGGEALPLVTLHGFLGAPSLWAPVFRTSALTERAVHRWLPGHGPDPWLPPGLWPETSPPPSEALFAQIIDAYAATLPVGATLVGYSLGARVALSLLARHPGRFAGGVIIGGHPGLDDANERAERARWDDEQATEITQRGLEAFVARWQSLPIFVTQANLPAPLLEAQRAARLAHQPRAVAWAMRALGLGALPSVWGSFAASSGHSIQNKAASQPSPSLLLVTGSLDKKFTDLAAQAAARWPGARHRVIAGAGHNVPLEASAALGALLRDELATQETKGRTL